MRKILDAIIAKSNDETLYHSSDILRFDLRY